MIDNSTKWLVRGNAVVTVIILLVMLFGGHAASGPSQGSTTTINGLTTNAPSSGVSNFNAVEADYGFFDTASATSNLLGSLTVAGGLSINNGFATSTGTTQAAISTTTSACVFNPPTATSTFAFSFTISSTSPNTTFLAFGTSTNPYATTSASNLVSQSNLTNQVQPISYTAGTNMFMTPITYGILYFTNGTTNGGKAQQLLGPCSLQFRAL